MKKLLYLAVCGLLTVNLWAQTGMDTVYAEIFGNDVVIHNDNAYRNCFFTPVLTHVKIENDTIFWYQVDTLGQLATCMCFFDYELSLDSLKPGTYKMQVYSVYNSEYHHDSTFRGQGQFTIKGVNPVSDFMLTGTRSSFCHDIEFLEELTQTFGDYAILVNQEEIVIIHQGESLISNVELISISGRVVAQGANHPEKEIHLALNALAKGIYIISVSDMSKNRTNRKIAVY